MKAQIPKEDKEAEILAQEVTKLLDTIDLKLKEKIPIEKKYKKSCRI